MVVDAGYKGIRTTSLVSDLTLSYQFALPEIDSSISALLDCGTLICLSASNAPAFVDDHYDNNEVLLSASACTKVYWPLYELLLRWIAAFDKSNKLSMNYDDDDVQTELYRSIEKWCIPSIL